MNLISTEFGSGREKLSWRLISEHLKCLMDRECGMIDILWWIQGKDQWLVCTEWVKSLKVHRKQLFRLNWRSFSQQKLFEMNSIISSDNYSDSVIKCVIFQPMIFIHSLILSMSIRRKYKMSTRNQPFQLYELTGTYSQFLK